MNKQNIWDLQGTETIPFDTKMMKIHAITHLSIHTESAKLRVDLNVHYGHWVIMIHQGRFTDCITGTIMVLREFVGKGK